MTWDGLSSQFSFREHRLHAINASEIWFVVVTLLRTAQEFTNHEAPPEMTANALCDWCRFSGAERSFIEPGSPWQNPFVESFGSGVRDEVLSIEAFDSVLEAQAV